MTADGVGSLNGWRPILPKEAKALVGAVAKAIIDQGAPTRGDYAAATKALKTISEAGYVLVKREDR